MLQQLLSADLRHQFCTVFWVQESSAVSGKVVTEVQLLMMKIRILSRRVAENYAVLQLAYHRQQQ